MLGHLRVGEDGYFLLLGGWVGGLLTFIWVLLSYDKTIEGKLDQRKTMHVFLLQT